MRLSSFNRDVFSLSRGVLVAQVLLFLAYPIITRIYSPDAFGQFGVIYYAAIVLVIFATAKADMILPTLKRPREANALLLVLLVWITIFCTVCFGLVLIFKQQLIELLKLSPDMGTYLVSIPLLTFFISLYTALRAWLVRRRRFPQIGLGNIFRAPVNIGVSLFSPRLIENTTNGAGLVLAQVAGDGVIAFWYARCIRAREWWVIFNSSFKQILNVLHENKKLLTTLFTSQSIATLHGRLAPFVIIYAYGPVEAGFYALADRIIAAPFALVAVPISDVYRQRAAKAYHSQASFISEFWQTLRLAVLLSLAPVIIALLAMPHVIGLVFGPEWTDATITLQILLVGAFFSFNHTTISYGSIIAGANRFIFNWHLFRFICEVCAGLLAVFGGFSYITYLVVAVALRIIAYVIAFYFDHRFAKGPS